jgi:GntR family transcriptional regulator
MVESGALKAGDQLPTVRQMATELRVNFNTIARAYRLLDEAGLISTQHGRGTYIWEEPDPEAIHALRQKSLQGLAQRFLAEAHRQKHSPEEVRAIIDDLLSQWTNGDDPQDNLGE